VRSGLHILPGTFDALKATFKRVIKDFTPELEAKAASWYSDHWVEPDVRTLLLNPRPA
jgi:hypothetical protein